MLTDTNRLFLEHIYDITINNKIKWKSDVNIIKETIVFTSVISDYEISISSEKKSNGNFSVFYKIYAPEDVRNSYKDDIIYISDYKSEEISQMIIDYIIDDLNIDMNLKPPETIFYKFLQDTALDKLRDNSIDNVLKD